MNLRTSLVGFLTLLFVTTLCCVFAQRNRLNDLRADQQRLLTNQNASGESTPLPVPETPTVTAPVPRELLRLRNDVSRLHARLRELSGVSNEYEQLRAMASTASNSPAGAGLPPGYIRKSQARMAGYTTPEATVETFLWAIKSRDAKALMQALTPESRHALEQQAASNNGLAELFKSMDALPGIQIVSRGTERDGTIEMQLQLIPGEPPARVKFLLSAGAWAMELP